MAYNVEARALRRLPRPLDELQPHGAIWGVAADTSRDDEVTRLVAEALVHLGRIDTLVNSAGIDGTGASALELTSADWRRVLEANLTGPFLVARAVARQMAAAGGGSIVNVASLTAPRERIDRRTPLSATWSRYSLLASHSVG